MGVLSPTRARLKTVATLAIAPMKAKSGTVPRWSAWTLIGSIMAIVAPKDAPADAPITYGSAIGFRKRA